MKLSTRLTAFWASGIPQSKLVSFIFLPVHSGKKTTYLSRKDKFSTIGYLRNEKGNASRNSLWVRYWGRGSQLLANFYSLSLVTVPDAFAKVNSVQPVSLLVSKEAIRPFYRYGGHIELIQFKEYYRMPRGHEHISFVFTSAFRDIFS